MSERTEPKTVQPLSKACLLISSHAVDCLNRVLKAQKWPPVSSKHFRPNIVVSGIDFSQRPQASWMEEQWSHVKLCSHKLTLRVVGPCARCSMVDVDPTSGSKGHTLRALAEYRRTKNGQITFGMFVAGSVKAVGSDCVQLCEGDELSCQ